MQGKENLQELVDEEAGMHPEEDSVPPKPQTAESRPGVDLLNLMDELPRQQEAVKTQRAAVPMQIVLSADSPGTHQQRGLQVEMAFQRESGQIYLDMRMTNFSENMLTDFAIQFNVNYFGLSPAAPLDAFELQRGAQQSLRLLITPGLKITNDPPSVPYLIQMALKCSLDIFYFQAPCMFTVLLVVFI
jgi:AP-1 complex subunit beta-1